jgi:hypothetical protein
VRQRGDEWQYKEPLLRERGEEKGTGGADTYREVVGERAVRLAVGEEAWATKEELVAIHTRRRSTWLQWRDRTLRLDLDDALWSGRTEPYAIAEIEALVTEEDEVDAALRDIRALTDSLGLDWTVQTPGKVLLALKETRPAVYAALQESGMIDRKMPPSATG